MTKQQGLERTYAGIGEEIATSVDADPDIISTADTMLNAEFEDPMHHGPSSEERNVRILQHMAQAGETFRFEVFGALYEARPIDSINPTSSRGSELPPQ